MWKIWCSHISDVLLLVSPEISLAKRDKLVSLLDKCSVVYLPTLGIYLSTVSYTFF